MLTFDAVTVDLGDFRLTATLAITEGERVAIIGPSGAGKSTLLGVVAGFTPHTGHISWKEDRIDRIAPGQRPVAVLFQDNNLFPHLTILQNVSLGIRTKGKLASSEQQAVRQAIARVGLSGYEDRKPAALSGGQQSRAALARLFVQAKPVLLLDEPFSALGPALKDEMLDLVSEVADMSGATVLMVTHDPVDALRLASRTIVVSDGQAAPPVPTKALLKSPPEHLASYLGRRIALGEGQET
ncbi:ATP-binding cassette domain-containing protein [Aestuariibius insulae]|uniref:thiamine ABC transporter ATP-binding protein n=1 Tax=Aestuariibius insulae TaxID=2058287 RepID=UPI00345EC827